MNGLMIFSAKYLYLVIIFSVLLYLFLQERPIQKRMVVLGLLGFAVVFLIAKILGFFYYDPRPFVVGHFTPLVPHDPTNGFPSDHALLSFSLASLLFIFNRKWGSVLFVLGLLVGVSRVYVGVHSPVDIVGSFVISSISIYGVYNLFFRKRWS